MGLTKWLAVQAGFSFDEAQDIGIGDERVDSGEIRFMEFVNTYACSGKDVESSGFVQAHHFPAASRLPADPSERVVVAGGDAAMAAAKDILKIDPSKSGFMLYKLGEALHPLQDSWSQQGIPDIPRPLPGVIECDPGLAWANSASRGGWNSHRADQTWAWPADTLAMASATYQVLTQYPQISGVKRTPLDWDKIAPVLEGFINSKTKADKQKWFVEHGISDVSFLQGISLPDGPVPFVGIWKGSKLPLLAKATSSQHHVDEGLLDFFNRLFASWITSDDFVATAAEFGMPPGSPPAGGTSRTKRAVAAQTAAGQYTAAQTAARLALWRIQDHGGVADMAHSTEPLTPRQLTSLRVLLKKPGVLVRYSQLSQAFLPILPKTPESTPLVPSLIADVPPSPTGEPRAIATVKFFHAPYDAVEVLAQLHGARWAVVSISATIEH
jgi:hypothetical protein